MENKIWILLCILGGVLMIIGSVVGNPAFFVLFGIASEYVGPKTQTVLYIILSLMTYVALGGGISVIIGAILVAIGQLRFGKLIIWLGLGTGLIGFGIFIASGIMANTLLAELRSGISAILGFCGVFIGVISRWRMKKEKKEED